MVPRGRNYFYLWKTGVVIIVTIEEIYADITLERRIMIMKLTKQQKLLLYLANESDRSVPAAVLSDYLGVSTRQIRKYVAKINEEKGADLILSGSQGYRIDMALYKEQEFLEIETPATRINYIIQKLISEKEGYDIFDLAEELYVSVPTIESDLREIRGILKKFELYLRRSRNNIFLMGDEKSKRILMSHLISSDSYDSFVLKDEVRMLAFHYEYWGFRTTIREIFAENDIFVNDYALNNIALHLIVVIDRIRSQYILEGIGEIQKIENTKLHRVSCQIREYIEHTYQVEINDAELYNLALVISNNTTMVDYNSITADNIGDYIEQNYIDAAHKIIREVEECYCLDAFDEDFIATFTIHVMNLFNRAKNGYFTKNPLTHKMKAAYPLIYDIAVFIAQGFKRDYDIVLPEDEIAYLAFHIGAYFENNVQKKKKVNCAFVYADYYSIHKNMLNQLMSKFENQINVKYAVPVDHYQPKKVDCDLIISTIKIPFHTQSIVIQPFLTDKDISRLRDVIETISAAKRNEFIKEYLLDFFDEKLFYKNPSFSNREEAITKMAGDVIDLGYALDTLREDMLARENMSGTAFGNVAVPHSLSKNTKTSFISIAVSDQPLIWGSSKVNLIAMIGVNEDSRKLFAEVFDLFIDIMSEPANTRQLLRAESFQEFMDILKTFMKTDAAWSG